MTDCDPIIRHWRDQRAPQDMVFALERWLGVLLAPELEGPVLLYRGEALAGTLRFRFALGLDGTGRTGHDYSLRAWAVSQAPGQAVDPKTAASWVDVWTGDLRETGKGGPAPHGPGSKPYAALAEAALSAAQQPDSVEAVQALIEAQMKAGAVFSTSHKEGGTRISWRAGTFRREDFGESRERQVFEDRAAFFVWLRQFYTWELTRAWTGGTPSELQVWRLLLRFLSAP